MTIALRSWRVMERLETGELRLLGRFEAQPGSASQLARMLFCGAFARGVAVLERDREEQSGVVLRT